MVATGQVFVGSKAALVGASRARDLNLSAAWLPPTGAIYLAASYF